MHNPDMDVGPDLELMSEVYPASVSPDLEQALATGEGSGGTAGRFAKNSILSIARLLISTGVALVLPAYLTHRLPVQTYSAWVLLLQISAYVGYLDFGVQTGVAKYVAEYAARNDDEGANARASAGLVIMLVAAFVGVVLIAFLAWRVPQFFSNMPSNLYGDARISLLLVGISLSAGLVLGVPSAIFIGLQRYGPPMVLALINRSLYTLVVVGVVFFHGSLALMGAGVALVNVFTGLLQVGAWRRWAGRVQLSLRRLNGAVVKEMFLYCLMLGIWSLGMLCVSGLDLTIVGHYDFSQTAFYSIATLPTNFIISIIGSAIGPLLPTASALSASRGPVEMGNLLTRLTRYCTLMLGVTGLPFMVAGYWILFLWVGRDYATHTVGYLHVLLLANIIRSLGLPYSLLLAAIGRQRVAIAGAAAEALVNVVGSVLLVRRMGAIGVAYGTLLGACVSVGVHFVINMRHTQKNFAVSRGRLFAQGVLRPLIIAVPSMLLVPLWWSSYAPRLSPAVWSSWLLSSLLLTWFVGLGSADRKSLTRFARARLGAVYVIIGLSDLH